MSILNDFLTFEHRSEHVFAHVLEHDLSKKPQFSSPKIYNANGDLSKRWYVYFSFRNPKTGKLERMKNIYGIANTYKKKEDRLAVLTVYRKRLLILLKKGYNPFENNEHLLEKENTQQAAKTSINSTAKKTIKPEFKPTHKPLLEKGSKATTGITEVKPSSPKLQEAFDLSLQLKKNVVNSRTLKDYTLNANKFIQWVKEEHPNTTNIDQLDKPLIKLYLNKVLTNTSARNYNNHRTNLGSLMQTMEDNDVITSNPIKKIKALKTKPERNKTYTKEEQTKIFEHLKKEDPILLLYIQFISYNFLRPIEVCRLKVKDINVKEGLLQYKSKNNPLVVKRIPDVLLEALPDLSQLNPDSFLFTPDKLGGFWDTVIENKRNYFTKRFRIVVKDHFKLGKNYGLYSFRHTFITKLYQSLITQYPPHEVKSRIMQITGHSTMEALEKYLRSIDAAIPADYSHLLK